MSKDFTVPDSSAESCTFFSPYLSLFCGRNVDRPFLLFFSMAHIHTPLFRNPAFTGKSLHGLYGDNIEEVDWMIGELTLLDY